MRRLALFVGCSVTVVACALTDAFKSAGIESVVIQYQGDTALTRGTVVPFTVAVMAGGSPVPAPHITVTSLDPTIVAVNAGQDSLVALKVGTARLTIVYQTSMFTDSAPTLEQSLRVHP